MLTWDGILEATETPQSNRSILRLLGIDHTQAVYTTCAVITKHMSSLGLLEALPDKSVRNGQLYKRSELNLKPYRSEIQVARDTTSFTASEYLSTTVKNHGKNCTKVKKNYYWRFGGLSVLTFGLFDYGIDRSSEKHFQNVRLLACLRFGFASHFRYDFFAL